MRQDYSKARTVISTDSLPKLGRELFVEEPSLEEVVTLALIFISFLDKEMIRGSIECRRKHHIDLLYMGVFACCQDEIVAGQRPGIFLLEGQLGERLVSALPSLYSFADQVVRLRDSFTRELK